LSFVAGLVVVGLGLSGGGSLPSLKGLCVVGYGLSGLGFGSDFGGFSLPFDISLPGGLHVSKNVIPAL